jgi:(1->4)-alpha-D-glucan 1-alpha-D-glucosylmutase
MTQLRATARLQFHRDFPIDRGTELVPYFARLGISHIYASPLLKARPGSTHGYDIVDHNTINPELGGEDELRRMVDALRKHDMGLILDIVPNHMGVGGADNAWWLDVLEWGRASPFAEFFDIDWDPPDTALRGKLLAPFLGASYGDALAAGDLRLKFDLEDGRFFVSAYDAHRFPISPSDYPGILRQGGMALEVLAIRFLESGPGGRDSIRKRMELGRQALLAAHVDRATAFHAALEAHNPDTEAGRARLHALLERQNYRLAWWRAAADEINWRRFFDINGLAGVRVERPEVFDATHATILRLYAEGLIDGVRVDHVDGLADPRAYCRKLRRKLETARMAQPEKLRAETPVLWVEKILFPHESLSTGWLTDGTTGYDFMNEASGVLHDPAGEARLTEIWTSLTGRPAEFEDEAQPARRQILRVALSSELNATAAAMHRIARRDLTTRDWTLTAIRRALEEVLVHFHTYRIYAGLGGPSESDSQAMAWAMAGARRTVRTADRDLLELGAAFLTGAGLRETVHGAARQEHLRAMVRFQQLSAPVAAKSVEDTAFYRYGRLLSRNEVGSEPSQFFLTPHQFHNAAAEREKKFPRALLATATHDHKRGEDTRARLAVLSEVPDLWEQALTRWTRLNARQKREIDRVLLPDTADEIMLYQMIVAAWPLDLSPDDSDGLAAYRDRLAAWQEKAVREAKRRSEWAAPNEAYENAGREFLAACLDPGRSAPLAREFFTFANRIAPAGAVNALSQTLLRLTVPGIPDLYQGTEFWDFSLVDPDNRRPVDFLSRRAALEAGATPASLADSWRDGRVKQAIIARALALRARLPDLFGHGKYQPLEVEGPRAKHVLAFARIHEERAAVVAITRLPSDLLGTAAIETEAALAGATLCPRTGTWDGTNVLLPRNLAGRWHTNALAMTDGECRGDMAGSERLDVAELFADLPVALLEVR